MPANDEKLQERIKEQGDLVRKLKAAKESKEKVAEEVAKLLVLKACLKEEGADEGSRAATGGGKDKFILKTAKGTRDLGPEQMATRNMVLERIVSVFRRHGAETMETPVFELREVLTGKYGEDSKLIYDLKDQGGEILSLRYDLTVPFARYLAMNKISSMKRYAIAKVYRRDNPSVARGRHREFTQCDFDIAGQYDCPSLADAECVRVVHEILELLDLGYDHEIKLNHRQLLDGILQVCGVPAASTRAICSSIDKLDKASWDEVRREMIDEKGLSPDAADRVGGYVALRGGTDLIDRLQAEPALVANASAAAGLAQLRELLRHCALLGVPARRHALDLSLARGLDYYTGVIFEAVLVPAAAAADSPPVDVGSVAGGGRYDELVAMFDPRAKRVPCVGVSVGVERIFAVVEARARRVRPVDTQVYVATAQKELHEQRLRLCAELWDAGLSAEHSYKRSPKLLAQLQACEERGVPVAVIVGESEIQRGVVRVRDVVTRHETEVSRDRLVEHVRAMLLRPPSSSSPPIETKPR